VRPLSTLPRINAPEQNRWAGRIGASSKGGGGGGVLPMCRLSPGRLLGVKGMGGGG
jgi:hypothetical protein